MFLFGKSRILATPRGPIAALLALAIALTGATARPTAASAQEGSVPAPVWDASLSGEICLPAESASPDSPPGSISAKAAVLMEAQSGELVFSKNPDVPLPMASTTKIMTALVALEQISPTTAVTIPAEAVGIEGSSVYLCEGETLTMEELLYALLLASANDAAVAIAIAVAGSVEAFADLMNRKAAALGLTDTHFVNPHGLDAEGHHTTARELAIIARAALENARFREICATRRKAIPLNGAPRGRWLLNHNKLLSMYPGCIGVKTGYTKKTGRCLVSAAEREGVTLIAVTLGAPDDWQDHTAMLNFGFKQYTAVPLCDGSFFSSPLPVVGGTREYVLVENTASLTLTLPQKHGSIRCVVELPRFDYAPIAEGQTVGRLVFYEEEADGGLRELGDVPLTAAYGADAVIYRYGPWEKIKNLFLGSSKGS